MSEENIEHVPVVDLIVHPDNPRQGDLGAIITSIKKNGWYGTVVAQRSTGHVLAGNHRLMAAQHLKLDTVPVYWADVDDATARRILLADNRTAELATYDNDQLVDLLTRHANADDLIGTGWDHDDVEDLIRRLQYDDRDLGDVMDEWVGMPDYDQPSRRAAFRTIVSFETDADADRFFQLIDHPKHKDLWWPVDLLKGSTGLEKKWVNDA